MGSGQSTPCGFCKKSEELKGAIDQLPSAEEGRKIQENFRKQLELQRLQQILQDQKDCLEKIKFFQNSNPDQKRTWCTKRVIEPSFEQILIQKGYQLGRDGDGDLTVTWGSPTDSS